MTPPPYDIDVNQAPEARREGRERKPMLEPLGISATTAADRIFDDIEREIVVAQRQLPPASAARIVAALRDTIEQLVGADPEAVERAAQRLLDGLQRDRRDGRTRSRRAAARFGSASCPSTVPPLPSPTKETK